MKKITLFTQLVLLVLAFASIGNAYSQNCPANLVSYWKMDEASGTTLIDYVNGNNATRNNSSSSIAGKVDNSQRFSYVKNGSNNDYISSEYAVVPNSSDFDFGPNSSFTICYWFRFNTMYDWEYGFEDHIMISKGDWNFGAPNTSFWASGTNGSAKVNFMLKDAVGVKTDLEGTTTFQDLNWHFVTCVRNGATDDCILYVDGTITDQENVNYTASFANTKDIYIGSLTQSNVPKFFEKGDVDEIAIYNKALTKPEIDALILAANNGTGHCSNEPTPPTITSTPVTTASVGGAYTYTVHATGTQAGMVYSLITKPTGMTIDGSSGEISWTPASVDIDAYVQVKADNGNAPSDTQSFRIYLSDGGTDCPSGLVTLHRLDETTGSTYADEMGSHDATVPATYSGPTPTTGIIGSAQQFGALTRLNIPDNGSEFDWSRTGSFSIESWFKTTTKGAAAISRNVTVTDHVTSWWIGTDGNGYPVFELRDNAATNTVLKGDPISIADNQWHHVVGVRDGDAGQNRIYVDGVLKNTLNQVFVTDFIAAGTLPVALGYLTPWVGGESELHLVGSIDESAVFNRALTGTEIAAFYNNGSPTGHCTASNFAPAIISTPLTTTNEDVAYNYTFEVDDINVTDTLTLSAFIKPSWLNFSWTPGQKTATLSGTPTNAGSFNVNLRVTDNHIVRNQVFTITVNNVLDAPVITSEPVDSTGDGELYTYTLTVTDSDASDVITMEVVTLPDWLTFNWVANAKTATITGTAAKTDIGEAPIDISITDGYAVVHESYTLTVFQVGGPPEITGQSALNVNEDESITIVKSNLTITDPDNPINEITIEVQSGANYTFDGNTVTPDANYNGELSVNIIAHDPVEYSSVYPVIVTVDAVNDAPVFIDKPDTTASVGHLYYYMINATDVDNTTLIYSASSKPDWLSFSEDNGIVFGTPEAANAGPHLIELKVSDGTNNVYQSFVLEVSDITPISETQNNEFVLYPVPVKDELNIKFNNLSEVTVVDIINSTGSIVESIIVPANAVAVKIAVNQLKAGFYICRIKNNAINTTSHFTIVK